MNTQWGQLWPFFQALMGPNGYILPILLVFTLAYGVIKKPRFTSYGKLFLFFLFNAFIWRLLYSLSMRAGIRYSQFPAVLWCAAGMTGIAGFHTLLLRGHLRHCRIAAAILLMVITGIGIGKSLHRPKPKKFISEVAEVLNQQPPGILLDCSEGQTRLRKLLPDWESVSGIHTTCGQIAFWNIFCRFVQQNQGKGKELYLLLCQPDVMPADAFQSACRREWGFEPFLEIRRITERRQNYFLLKYSPPETLFGLPLVTAKNPNPYGLKLPEIIHVSEKNTFSLNFDSILRDNPFAQWGGVELMALAGQCFDDHWEWMPETANSRTIPVSVTLFLPNGWPVGYAETIIQLTDKKSDVLPETIQKRSAINPALAPNYWNAVLPLPDAVLAGENTELLWKQAANLKEAEVHPCKVITKLPTSGKLAGTLFWIGSRVNGTKWTTDQLQKRNPGLSILRLEDHPVLPYSGDPRYNFVDLATARQRVNPLLNGGKVNWRHYCKKENVPDNAVIVIALGYEEVQYQGWQKAFHIDDAVNALRTFLDDVTKNNQQSKILLIAPNLPAEKDCAWASMSANPYNYGFRWLKRQSYQRLINGLFIISKSYSQTTLLPSFLFVPAGENERSGEYVPAIERYLFNLFNKNEQNHENTLHP